VEKTGITRDELAKVISDGISTLDTPPGTTRPGIEPWDILGDGDEWFVERPPTAAIKEAIDDLKRKYTVID
jgi:hypothetical protein